MREIALVDDESASEGPGDEEELDQTEGQLD
jgi:hypothetical protein